MKTMGSYSRKTLLLFCGATLGILAILFFFFPTVASQPPKFPKVDERDGRSTNDNMISGVQDSIAKQSYEKGIGWQGEILNPRSKLVNGIRSTTYDFDRGLARHIPAWPLTDDMAKAESFGADFCLSFSVSNDHGEPDGQKRQVCRVPLQQLADEVLNGLPFAASVLTHMPPKESGLNCASEFCV